MRIDELPQKDKERPTLKTISKLTGFSVPTVSRALSDAPDIKTETKKTVHDLAQKLGYRRDRAAVRLRTGKTNVIALIVSTDHELMNLTARLVGSIAGALRHTPYQLILTPYFADEDPMEPVKYIVRTGSADGIIINRVQSDDPRVKYLQRYNFPFALHGRVRNSKNLVYADYDNDAFAASAVRTMANKNRREFLLVGPPRDQNYGQLMINGARRACEEIGGKLYILEGATSDDAPSIIERKVWETLKARPTIDAVIAPSTTSCMAATLAIEGSNRHLGQDIDIAAKEGTPFLKAFRKEILVTLEEANETGQFLAEALVENLKNRSAKPRQLLLQPAPFE